MSGDLSFDQPLKLDDALCRAPPPLLNGLTRDAKSFPNLAGATSKADCVEKILIARHAEGKVSSAYLPRQGHSYAFFRGMA
jgi:hypothetical protein